MDSVEQNQIFSSQEGASISYLDEQIDLLKAMLSYGLNLPVSEIKISFPTLKNFYLVNNIYKSSWAIYTLKDKMPQLLYTGNFLIQGGEYGRRSPKSIFGAKALSPLTSLANTFSREASVFKQNWALDLNLFEEDGAKLSFSVKEYQEFLTQLNFLRSQCLLHISEEGNFDLAIGEFSEPSDPIFFMDLEDFYSQATKIKTYFKPISEKALNLFQSLSTNTEFEGKFFSLQPGTWVRDEVLIELEKFYSEKFFIDEKIQIDFQSADYSFNNPFKVQVLKPSF